MTKENKNTGRKPTRKLVQEKAYYKTVRNGQQKRTTEIIEITRGWDEVGQESGIPYISWADTTMPIMPDVDGRIVLRTFEITYDQNK